MRSREDHFRSVPEGGTPRRVIIACRVMETELQSVGRHQPGVTIRYLDQGLHRTPEKMAPLVQGEADRASTGADRIVLGYGLCSNGIVGVKAGAQGLLVPRCHDCIGFFFGSLQAYGRAFEQRPGTYYLTNEWIREKKDPLGIVEDDYAPRIGMETAVWVMEEELKHYTHIALINTGAGDLDFLRRRTTENASFFKKEYLEVRGGLEFFSKIVEGPYKEEDFLFIRPGESIRQEMFWDEDLGLSD